ncbi:MAG TPA: DISARM system helicase DrmA [Polyangia bacterium]|jgi:hypothetical protein
MTAATETREHLVRALTADLVGPFDLDNPDAAEVLSLPPSRWYLTGFLAPELSREEEDPTADEEMGAGDDEDEEETAGQEPEPKQKKRLPASLGLSVLLPPGSEGKVLTATVSYADYLGAGGKEGKRPRTWVRQSRPPMAVAIVLDPQKIAAGFDVPGSGGIKLIGKLGPAAAPGLPKGTLALALFVVNRRSPAESKARQDEQFIFQVSLQLELASGFMRRSNRRGEQSDDWDDRVGDLQFRERCEYAVGHGVSAEVLSGEDPVTAVRTAWVPWAEVRRVTTRTEPGVEVRMEELANLADGTAVSAALSRLPQAYGQWIDAQAATSVDTPERAETRDELMRQARRAQERIAAGIEVLRTDAGALDAFRLANRAMAEAARRRNPERYPAAGAVPEWRLFQLAFVLLTLRGLVDEAHPDRDAVELIFFPTGGGKTEAYLGVIAVTLLLRRLRGMERPDRGYGVAVLLRYTLRLLTLDQLGRAATLICALEKLRQVDPKRLGDVRFSVGLWVGKSATANTLAEVGKKIVEYKNSPSKAQGSPFPLPSCPWCGAELNRDSLELWPSRTSPSGVLVGCTNYRCDFAAGKNREGLPVLFVDEQVYRELPAFIVATVDKFAMLPWRGETGMLFGRVHGRTGNAFFGPLDGTQKGDQRLPNGLRPPELIVQDELHLIAGPLGTMVGLYETAIEALCTRDGAHPVRPKILAATATVRRAGRQIQALFGRADTAIFPPPGISDSMSYFAELDREAPGRLYVGVGASGRAMKRILLRTYVSLLTAAQKRYDPKGPPDQTADAYMTLVGYFNSLRELGGMRRLVEDEVRNQCLGAADRKPENVAAQPWAQNRVLQREPLELTSRESTGRIKEARARLAQAYADKERVDVLLASNMISVGIDIDRLGLMVVAGQPKTTSEYIQASSRVGRNTRWPGLVVTCFNLYKPRDRSHYERFTAYHETFYRFVEAMSLTPFSGPALDRGLAGTLVAMTRLLETNLTPALAAMDIDSYRETAKRAVRSLVERSAAQPTNGSDPSVVRDRVGKRAQNVLDAWTSIVVTAKQDEASTRSYSRFDRDKASKRLLFTPLDDEKPAAGTDEAKFSAPTSMRDVEPVVHLWLMRGRLGGKGNA